LAQLRAAIDRGFFDTNELQRDPDLESLRTRPDWNSLLQKAAEAKRLEDKRWNDNAFATSYRPVLSETEKQAGLALIWAEARYGFANFDLAPDELDWNARYIEFIPRVAAAKTTIDYYRQLKAFVSGLHDGHSSVSFPPEIRNGPYGRPALRTERIGEDVVVTRVIDASLPIRVGDVIRSIDGEPVEEYAETLVAPYVSYSTPQDRAVRVYDYDLLYGPTARPVRLGLVNADGGARTVTVPRKGADGSHRASSLPFELQWEPHDIAYVRLNSFGSMDAANLWHEHYEAIRQRARGIVFDVRANGGGSTGVGYAILADVIDHANQTSSSEVTVYRSTLRAWGFGQRRETAQISNVAPSSRARFDGPVAVLIGSHTYSAAEDFVVAFDMADRGALIGAATGGSTGQPLSFPLPGGGSARVCTKRDRYADGREFVGVGIQPDIEVQPTVASIRAGEDPALARALAWIREQE
jgi:carboxyl-terminal processing protease